MYNLIRKYICFKKNEEAPIHAVQDIAKQLTGNIKANVTNNFRRLRLLAVHAALLAALTDKDKASVPESKLSFRTLKRFVTLTTMRMWPGGDRVEYFLVDDDQDYDENDDDEDDDDDNGTSIGDGLHRHPLRDRLRQVVNEGVASASSKFGRKLKEELFELIFMLPEWQELQTEKDFYYSTRKERSEPGNRETQKKQASKKARQAADGHVDGGSDDEFDMSARDIRQEVNADNQFEESKEKEYDEKMRKIEARKRTVEANASNNAVQSNVAPANATSEAKRNAIMKKYRGVTIEERIEFIARCAKKSESIAPHLFCRPNHSEDRFVPLTTTSLTSIYTAESGTPNYSLWHLLCPALFEQIRERCRRGQPMVFAYAAQVHGDVLRPIVYMQSQKKGNKKKKVPAHYSWRSLAGADAPYLDLQTLIDARWSGRVQIENLRGNMESLVGKAIAIIDPGTELLITGSIGRFVDEHRFECVTIRNTQREMRAMCGTDAAIGSSQAVLEELRNNGVEVDELVVDDDGDDDKLRSAIASLKKVARERAYETISKIANVKADRNVEATNKKQSSAKLAGKLRRGRQKARQRWEACICNRLLHIARQLRDAWREDGDDSEPLRFKDLLVFVGRGGYSATAGGTSGMTAQALHKVLAKRFKVVTVNEFFTSQLCFGCGEHLTKVTAKINDRRRTCDNAKYDFF